jgi:hypothetical protein
VHNNSGALLSVCHAARPAAADIAAYVRIKRFPDMLVVAATHQHNVPEQAGKIRVIQQRRSKCLCVIAQRLSPKARGNAGSHVFQRLRL